MSSQTTHFRYVCRVCKTETLQPVLKDAPENTPTPSCCGSRRNMAYVGVHSDLPEGGQHIRPVDTRKVDIVRAVIEESPPDTRFLVTEDVSFLDLKLPSQDK